MHIMEICIHLTFYPCKGTVPGTLCNTNGTSPLSDLHISNNRLSGALDVSNCLRLVQVDAGDNHFTDFDNPTGYNKLHTVHLSRNNFGNEVFSEILIALSDGGHVSDLAISWNM